MKNENELKIVVCPAEHVEDGSCQCRPRDKIQKWEKGVDIIITECPIWIFNSETGDLEIKGTGGIDKAVITSKYGGIIGKMLIQTIKEVACEHRNELEKHCMCCYETYLPGLLGAGFEDRIMAKVGIKCKVAICSPC